MLEKNMASLCESFYYEALALPKFSGLEFLAKMSNLCNVQCDKKC